MKYIATPIECCRHGEDEYYRQFNCMTDGSVPTFKMLIPSENKGEKYTINSSERSTQRRNNRTSITIFMNENIECIDDKLKQLPLFKNNPGDKHRPPKPSQKLTDEMNEQLKMQKCVKFNLIERTKDGVILFNMTRHRICRKCANGREKQQGNYLSFDPTKKVTNETDRSKNVIRQYCSSCTAMQHEYCLHAIKQTKQDPKQDPKEDSKEDPPEDPEDIYWEYASDCSICPECMLYIYY